MWLKFEGFKDLLRGWWQSLHFFGSFSFVLASKLKALKGILRAWNKEVFGRVDLKKKAALSRISFWDDVEKEKKLSLEEAEEREKAREDYKKWVDLEEVSWRQKSKEIWLKEGDRNTGFFHRMTNSHRRRNSIRSIRIVEDFSRSLRLKKVWLALSKVSSQPQTIGARLFQISNSI